MKSVWTLPCCDSGCKGPAFMLRNDNGFMCRCSRCSLMTYGHESWREAANSWVSALGWGCIFILE
jgi:hypothetical protein